MRACFAFFSACMLALVLWSGGEARAQGENVMNWRATAPRIIQVERPRQTYQPRRRSDAATPRRPASEVSYAHDVELGLHMPEFRIALPLPPDEQRIKVALVGDSLAEALGFGFEADTAFKTDFLLRSRFSSSSGLVRDDYFDWPKNLAALMAEHGDLAAIIISMGLSDRQSIRNGSETLEPLSEAWREAYRKRIDQLMSVARASGLPVIWMGLPVVRLPKFSADLMQMNEMIRDRVQVAGGVYLDIVDAFADGNGGFTSTGPDVIGDIVRLRGSDGIHFTPAGQRKLAFFAERPLRRVLGDRQRPPQAMAIAAPSLPGLPVPALVPETPTPEPASVPALAPALTPGDFGIPLPSLEGLAITMPRPRPSIGETRLLNETRPATALTGRSRPGYVDETSRDMFDRGLAPAPRAGRSDDFSWRAAQ